MSEKWIHDLVNKIKAKDNRTAEDDLKKEQTTRLLETKGPIAWGAFADVLRQYWDEAKSEFGNAPTAGIFTFRLHSQNQQITMEKRCYPQVSFTAIPDFKDGLVDIQYSAYNPDLERTPQEARTNMRKSISCRLEIEDNEVVLHLQGKPYRAIETAAEFIVDKLLSV